MDCTSARERMPFRLNRTLEDDEAQAVEAHLRGCAACREEWEETRGAALVLGAHLPARALVDLAWDRPVEDVPRDILERHLAGCRSCSDELALARESRRAEAAEEPARPAPRPGSVRWRWAGLAASLALAFVTGRAWESRRDDAAVRSAEDRARQAAARADALRRRLEDLRATAPAAEAGAAPRNLELVELLPAESLRGPGDDGSAVVAGDTPVALSLVLDSPGTWDALRLVARDDSGAELWRAQSLELQQAGDVVVLVPADRLAPGRIGLVLEGRTGEGWRPVASYRLEIRAP